VYLLFPLILFVSIFILYYLLTSWSFGLDRTLASFTTKPFFFLLSTIFLHIFTFGSRRSFSTSSMHFNLDFPLPSYRKSYFQKLFQTPFFNRIFVVTSGATVSR
jgi:hypothetical protein